MEYLRRGSAPLSERVWKALDEAVGQSARHVLAARRVSTFDGPRGWDHIGARRGVMRPCHDGGSAATVCVPEVALLVEIRADFSIPWSAIEVFERGAPALDTEAAERAARDVARAEDLLVFYGDPTGTGFLTSKESLRHEVHDWSKPGQVLADLVSAVAALDAAGIGGPYEAVLPPAGYYAYLQAMVPGGYPVARQLQEILAGVHRSSMLREAGAVFSTRGSDFVITVGGDISVGYREHARSAIHLMCVETIGAQTLTPEAVCMLVE
jgi:uncharacterized linocin/CFP29 family protein